MLSKSLQEKEAQNLMGNTDDIGDVVEKETIQGLNHMTDTLVDLLNTNLSTSFQLEKDIEEETRQLQEALDKHQKTTKAWLHLTASFNTALKELGDVQSWTNTIKKDTEIILQTLKNVKNSS